MTFKLTYATMFNPPEELHTNFDAATTRLCGRLGAEHALYVAGEDRSARASTAKMNPADVRQQLGRFAAATALDADAALRAAHDAWPVWRKTAAAGQQ